MNKLSLDHGGARIPFSLKRSARRTVGIRIGPDASVTVTAPFDMPIDRILSLLRTKMDWMARKRREVRGRARENGAETGRVAAFENGGLFPYLGSLYTLQILDALSGQQTKRGRVTIGPAPGDDAHGGGRGVVGVLSLSCPLPADAERIAGMLRRWYRAEANRVISERLDRIWNALPAGRIPGAPVFSLRRMKRRWGSCSASGIVTLNPYLVCVPPRCVDYVILHELCHRLEHNHGRGYYLVLSGLLPCWKEVRKELKAQPFIYF